MARMAAESHQNYTATMSSIRSADAGQGRPNRRPSLSPDQDEDFPPSQFPEPPSLTPSQPRPTTTPLHPLVPLVEFPTYTEFGFLLFRTDYSSDSRWARFLEVWDELVGARIEAFAAAEEEGRGTGSGLARVVDRVFVKIVDDEEALGERQRARGMGGREVAL